MFSEKSRAWRSLIFTFALHHFMRGILGVPAHSFISGDWLHHSDSTLLTQPYWNTNELKWRKPPNSCGLECWFSVALTLGDSFFLYYSPVIQCWNYFTSQNLFGIFVVSQWNQQHQCKLSYTHMVHMAMFSTGVFNRYKCFLLITALCIQRKTENQPKHKFLGRKTKILC